MACLAPRKLADGTEGACRECKQCQLTQKNEWIGRNIAESKTSKFCYVITATYGRGKVGESLHERAVILTPSDVQKFMKLLRRHGYECRVFYTGEYGSERQRAHWNIILYSQKPLPSFSGWDQFGRWKQHMNYTRRFNWVRTDAQGEPVYLQNGEPAWFWPHGFVHVDQVSIPSVKYVCKYVLKDFDANGRQGHKGQSKNPPLGAVYFKQLAQKYVKQGLAPQSPEYRFPEAKTREGEPIRYWLKGRSCEMFLQAYIDAWAERRPNDPRPRSDFVELYEKYGKVVNDEAAMLLRQEFPDGESKVLVKQRFPDGAEQIKREAEAERYHRAAEDHGRLAERLNESDQQWIDTGHGEERQRRERTVAKQRAKRWYAFNHEWGRHWYEGWGWIHPTEGLGPCQCCERPERLAAEPEQRAAGPSRGERQQPDCGLGEVGRYNRDYGQPGRTGPSQGGGSDEEKGPR